MVQDGIAGSSATLTKMTCKLRLVCRKALKKFKRKTGQHIGGRTEFVMIDESNFRHKRKYRQGRAGQTWRRKKWVFGMLAIKGQRRLPILRLVERRSRNHLLPIIRRHVRQGSTILSDEWRPYRALSSLGYTHYSVNHSRWFVDPNHGGHTQNIERACAVGYIPTGHADVKFETRESIYNTEFIDSPEDVKNQQYISSDSERSFTNTY
ncbi:uncharacterized protein LOC130080107 [Rhinichthys klamathensis goyatoka]|uniref:uncharacterized protein LOC130080107 n=1 Tax=Rhinichthys klamathensis goyatoka TaxID=3034132 RepID=UPI0024B4A45A|nr:uncharacterized protein LOC130080107 [Rhinichthys klamathensis goyatoka]